MKTLQEVLDVQSHAAHQDPAWKASGFGPTSWTTVRNLVGNKPIATDAVDAPANIDQDFKKKMMAFFDTLGDILVQDYPHDTSVFDIPPTHHADGHRPADRMVGESLVSDSSKKPLNLTQAPIASLKRFPARKNGQPVIGTKGEELTIWDAHCQGKDYDSPFVRENAEDWLNNLKTVASSQAPNVSAPEDPNFADAQKRIWREVQGIPEGPEADAAWEQYQQFNNERRGQNEATAVGLAFDMINEAVIQEVGRLYEATVSIRGLQRNMRIFFPSMGVASRRELQESLNKVFSGAVLIKMVPLSEGGRITKAPFIILENDARYQITENVVVDSETNTVIIFEEKKCDKMKKPKKDKKDKKEKKSPLVREAFERYRGRLEQLNENGDVE